MKITAFVLSVFIFLFGGTVYGQETPEFFCSRVEQIGSQFLARVESPDEAQIVVEYFGPGGDDIRAVLSIGDEKKVINGATTMVVVANVISWIRDYAEKSGGDRIKVHCFGVDKRVQVYCFSQDLEAGFEDEAATYMCQGLQGLGNENNSLALVETRDEAQVLVQFLGLETITKPGETAYIVGGYPWGYAWRPNKEEGHVSFDVFIGDYKKEFRGEGVYFIERWIRENKHTILAKAKQE